MACPTCFCSTVEDTSSLDGQSAERWRRWDSCFTMGHSYVHGGSVRNATRARYRQWLTHKVASWIDQFGTSGCVGCGRCITWCPVGIDITEELAEIRKTDGRKTDGSTA
jgi:predicted aldo/keto reductase-like oxidoreductase